MKRVVIAAWGSLGDLHPYLAIGRELASAGHEVVVATMLGYRERVEAHGFAFRPLAPHLPSPSQAPDLVKEALHPLRGPGYLIGRLLLPALRESHEDLYNAVTEGGVADMLVSHPTVFAAPLVAKQVGALWVSTDLAPATMLLPGDPPAPPHWPGLRRVMAWHPRVARAIFQVAYLGTWRWAKEIREFAKELGIDLGEHPLFAGRFSKTLHLGLFSRLLLPGACDVAGSALITGFPFYESDPDPGELTRLKTFLASGEPPIVFTLGSTAAWAGREIYRAGVAAAARLKRRAIVLAGGPANVPGDLPGDKVAVFDYMPHGSVMPHAACVVHHGGIGTTAQALRAGRPMLVLPYGFDTPDNARRCRDLGVARVLGARQRTERGFELALRDVLSDEAARQRASEVSELVRAENGAADAAAAIESLLRRT